MSDAFTKPSDDFDLDAWISGAKLPERTQTVYGRADLIAEHEELSAALVRARSAALDDSDERLSAGADVSTLERRIVEVEDAMAASALTFRFRAILSEELDEAKRAVGKDADESTLTYELLSRQCVHPRVPAERWQQIRARIGEGQFAALTEAASSASFDRQVSVPFSLAASRARSTRGS